MAGSGPDVIDLSGVTGTHTLTVVDNSTYGDTGLPVVRSAITIEGNGSTITRDGSAPAFRIFAVNGSGNLTFNETTVSGGLAAGGVPANAGGGLYNSGTATLTNSTVSGNSAGSNSGGVYNRYGGTATLARSIISGNTAPAGAEVRNRDILTADDFNLFGHSALTNAQAFDGFTPGASDITATSDGTTPTALANILAPLANNGGPTQTHALVAGSPAIDPIPDTDCPPPADDQRGVIRPQDGDGNNTPRCDIGAFELEPPPPPPPPPPLPPPPLCNGRTATLFGTHGDDQLTGTPGNDVIHGLAGNDTIAGLDGNDLICGGPGRDRLSGNRGNDQLFGDVGNDVLMGGSGRDRLFGQRGRGDRCDGGSGIDRATRCERTTRVP